jgi:hypothetical protein
MTNSWYDIVPKASENVANQQKTSLTLGTRSVQARLQLHPPARAQSAFSLFVEQGFSSTSMQRCFPKITSRKFWPKGHRDASIPFVTLALAVRIMKIESPRLESSGHSVQHSGYRFWRALRRFLIKEMSNPIRACHVPVPEDCSDSASAVIEP